MTRITKETYPGVSEEKRKTDFAKVGFGLRKNKRTSGLYVAKKTSKKRKNG